MLTPPRLLESWITSYSFLFPSSPDFGLPDSQSDSHHLHFLFSRSSREADVLDSEQVRGRVGAAPRRAAVRRRWGSGKLPCGERRRAVSGAGSPVGSSAATPLVPPGRILVAADPGGSSKANLGGGEYGELRRRGARRRTPAKSFKSDLGGALIIF
jgi:hypothetical protein